MILTKCELRESNIYLAKELDSFFGYSKSFPCLFAINSYHKNMMFFADYTQCKDVVEVIPSIALDLIEFHEIITPKIVGSSFPFYTLIFLLPEPSVPTHSGLMSYVMSILDELRKLDALDWPENKVSDIFHQDFEFYFNQKRWFPVLLTPCHVNEIRKSNVTMFAFQPGIVFDHLRNNNTPRYQKTRQAVHRKVDIFYKNNRPYYLTAQSSGKNLVQYLGFDPVEVL